MRSLFFRYKIGQKYMQKSKEGVLEKKKKKSRGGIFNCHKSKQWINLISNKTIEFYIKRDKIIDILQLGFFFFWPN